MNGKVCCVIGILVLSMLFAGTAGADIYVAATGDDATGDGTEAAPYRTVKTAIANLGGDTVVRVGIGLYDAAAGEVFPLVVPAGVSIIGTVGPAQDESDSAVLDAAGAARMFTMPNSTTMTTLKGLVMKNAKGMTVDMTNNSTVTVEDSVITGVTYVSGEGAVAHTNVGSGVTTLNLTRTTVRDIARVAANTNSYIIRLKSGNGTLNVTDCLFKNIAAGTVEGKRGMIVGENVAGTFLNSVFDTISWVYSGTWAGEVLRVLAGVCSALVELPEVA